MLRHFTAINLMPGRVSYVGQSNISLQRVRLNDTRSLNDRLLRHCYTVFDRIRVLFSPSSTNFSPVFSPCKRGHYET